MTVGASPPVDARSSPIASGWPCQSTSSHWPPASRTKSHTHCPAACTSALCEASALIEGIRRNSASSSNQASGTAASLPFLEVRDAGQPAEAVREDDLTCAQHEVRRRDDEAA